MTVELYDRSADIRQRDRLKYPYNVYAHLLDVAAEIGAPLCHPLVTALQLVAPGCSQTPAKTVQIASPLFDILAEYERRVGTGPERDTRSGGSGAEGQPTLARLPKADLLSRTTNDEKFDVVYAVDASADLDPVDFLDKIIDLAKDDGKIALVDEFIDKRKMDFGPSRSQINYRGMMNLLSRLGVEVDNNVNLTAAAEDAARRLVDFLEVHRPRLIFSRGLSPDHVDSLIRMLRTKAADLASGHLSCRLLLLNRKNHAGWRMRRIHLEDHEEFSALFKEVFKVENSKEHWRWKYQSMGPGVSCGAWVDGKLVVHYGSMVRPARVFGKKATLSLPGDVMAKRGVQKALKLQSLFYILASVCQEHYGGYGTSNVVGAGFPNLRHQKSLSRSGLYTDPVDRIVELSWTLEKDIETPPRATEVSGPQDEASKRLINALWAEMANDLADCVVACRGWREIVTRYIKHPVWQYAVYLAPAADNGRPIGAFVLKAMEGERVELMDVIGPVKAHRSIIAEARRVAAARGAKQLWGWYAEACVAERIVDDTSELKSIDVNTVQMGLVPAVSAEELMGRMWLTSGDVDFH